MMSFELDTFPTVVKFTVIGAWKASQLPEHSGKSGPTGNLIRLCTSTLATSSYYLIRQEIGYPGRSEISQ